MNQDRSKQYPQAERAKRADGALTARVVDTLEQSARNLDGATASRLNRARQRAVAEALRSRAPWGDWRLPLAVAGTLGALAVATALWQASPPADLPVLTDPTVADLALLSSEDDFEFYENLEFYHWLEEEMDAG